MALRTLCKKQGGYLILTSHFIHAKYPSPPWQFRFRVCLRGLGARITRYESRFHIFLTSLLRYLPTSSFTNNCKLTTVNCFSPRPVDIQPFASDNSLSAPSPRMAPITEEGE